MFLVLLTLQGEDCMSLLDELSLGPLVVRLSPTGWKGNRGNFALPGREEGVLVRRKRRLHLSSPLCRGWSNTSPLMSWPLAA